MESMNFPFFTPKSFWSILSLKMCWDNWPNSTGEWVNSLIYCTFDVAHLTAKLCISGTWTNPRTTNPRMTIPIATIPRTTIPITDNS
jgi:hypothetical protein